MATHHGIEGSAAIGANTIAELQGWTLEIEIDTADDTEISDTWDTHLTGRKRWNGTISCSWDETDTNGQGAMTEGASVTLNLYPEGAVAGDTYWTGTATITSRSVALVKDGVTTQDFNYVGNGALTEGTV